jgi:hypothetical protein
MGNGLSTVNDLVTVEVVKLVKNLSRHIGELGLEKVPWVFSSSPRCQGSCAP